MVGSRAPPGSLRNHASSASKAPKGGVFGSQPTAPKLNPGTFVGSGTDSESSGGGASSDDDNGDSEITNFKIESASEFMNRIGQTPQSKKKAEAARATPAKSPTVNGLRVSTKKNATSKKVKKEDTSSPESSESDGESASSRDEKHVEVRARSEEPQKSKKHAHAVADDSESSEAREVVREKANKSTAKGDKKHLAEKKSETKAKHVKPDTTYESESESAPESRSQNISAKSDSDLESEDPEYQIQQQIKDDVKSAKATKVRGSSSKVEASKKEVRNKKPKASKISAPADDDGDIELADQSIALTNGGAPTTVGSVPEFVAPDFHLRKLDGSIDASDVANFFAKAQMEGKQVWYITAPASLPVTVVQDLTIPMDQAQKELPVLTHDGDDYRLAFDDPSASSSFRLFIPNKQGNEYAELGRPINKTMHFTRSETFPPEGLASVTTTQTISKTTRPARPQPEGLRARCTPLGVPAPKPKIPLVESSDGNKVVARAAAQEAAEAGPPKSAKEAAEAGPPKSSSKKKRKHDGESGPAAAPNNKESSKTPGVEKSAKKQKITKDHEPKPIGHAGRKETPVPLPPQVSSGSGFSSNGTFLSSKAAAGSPSRTQPRPASRISRSASPGASLTATQLPVKKTPIPIPVPVKYSSSVGNPDAKALKGKERKEKNKKTGLPAVDQVAERVGEMAAAKSSDKASEKAPRTPKKATPIHPPRFDSKGRPLS